MTVILPDWIPQLMFFGEAEALVSDIRQILLPELSVSASIDLPMNILGFQYKYTIAGNYNMVDLRRVFSVKYKKVIVNPVFLAVQIF